MPSLKPDRDKNFGGSLVFDFGQWWHHVKTIYWWKASAPTTAPTLISNGNERGDPPPPFHSITFVSSPWEMILLGNHLKQRRSQSKLTEFRKTVWTSFLHVLSTISKTAHKTLNPLTDVSVFHYSVLLSYFFSMNCACKVVKYKKGWYIAKYTIPTFIIQVQWSWRHVAR